MGRLIAAGAVVYEQLDFYSPPTVRAIGVAVSNLTLKLFANNQFLDWPLVDGSTVVDSSISAGSVYFNAISGFTDYYGIRFYPHQIGFWRLIIRHNAFSQEIIKELDIMASGSLKPTSSGGLNASFIG